MITYQHWIKILTSKKQWDGWYSKLDSYCKLNETSEGVWIGFVVAKNYEPLNYMEVSDEEIKQIDNYRQAKNITPEPLKINQPSRQIDFNSEKRKQKNIEALNKIKAESSLFNN